MKILIKIFFTLTIIIFFNGCGENHNADEQHSHDTDKENSENKEINHEHKELTSVITLTQEQVRTVGIEYGSIAMKGLTATIKTNGRLKVPNNNKANATSVYGGIVTGLHIQVGDYVPKGQTIAMISNPQFVQLQEEYLTVGTKIIFAEQELQRQKELNEGSAGSGRNLQSALTELNTLKIRKGSLQQQIALMGINPDKIHSNSLKSVIEVKSPLSGTVSNVFTKIGSYVDVTSPVAEIVDNGAIHLDINVFESDLPLLKVGQTIHFTLTNNPINEYDAEVFSIGTSFENESKTISVHALVKGNKTGLIDGMNITANVNLDNVVSSAVLNEAIVNTDGKSYIFIVSEQQHTDSESHNHEDGKAHNHEQENTHVEENIRYERIEVLPGISDMGYTAITPINEIPEKAKIVTKGAFFINAKLSNSGEHHH